MMCWVVMFVVMPASGGGCSVVYGSVERTCVPGTSSRLHPVPLPPPTHLLFPSTPSPLPSHHHPLPHHHFATFLCTNLCNPLHPFTLPSTHPPPPPLPPPSTHPPSPSPRRYRKPRSSYTYMRPEMQQRHAAFKRGSAYLERYCQLIAFAYYLEHVGPEAAAFQDWVASRPDLKVGGGGL